ncbi:YbaY family lipoprotein [Mesorhizobium sp. MSK_1335]|uniref:YbaY family lipoprotein n=1 Tax=Mesorhizobium montanum TaxID=3072323 RepID=A0ABU4ZPJ3_9HYPH|nr:YbaY family lipoprotein [Mesorhizobium sp. MSK_1335]MDX8526915.1 YbaY family lipoprotein [Mesorhizobium sp. MSK_1335]
MLDRITEFFIFGLVPLVVGVLAVPEVIDAGERTIAGEVIYRERIALPPDAVLVVELADVSLADAPAAVIAKRRIAPAGQVPIRFEIGFDPKTIQKGRTYTLQARITVGERVLFITDTSHHVDPLAGKPRTVVLKMATS